MKTKTLENGTILEVGEKYESDKWKGLSDKWKGFIKVKYLGESIFVFIAEDGIEEIQTYINASDNWNLQPYQEPKKMVKLYKYAYLNHSECRWFETTRFYESDENFKSTCTTDKFIRLDYTEIEVEDYD
jgi:hypothetical protein